MHFSR